MSSEPTEIEFEILKEIAGLKHPRPWGAHVGAALEFLQESGYITGLGSGAALRLTEKGQKYLERKALH